MPRLNIPLSVSIQFDNPVQPPAYGAAAVMTSVSLATNDAGRPWRSPRTASTHGGRRRDRRAAGRHERQSCWRWAWKSAAVPNLRLIHDNAADRATSLAASTTSGALVAAYLQNDFKGQAHRSTGTSVSYTLTWTAGETVGGVALPATNLSASATIRCACTATPGGSTLIADSGAVYACPA